MVAVLVRDDVGLRERPPDAPNRDSQLLEEAEVDVDLAVDGQ